ncbi:MAG TPA: nitrogenase component 1, partial [Desulfobacteria bacterium]|nr:nitrogenase component 1 [Desulfobacteria bacterium]
SGAGCGLGQLFGQHYAGGQNTGGPQGTTSTPCSCLVEEHVIFGGEKKLRQLIDSTIKIMNGDLFAVISGCVPSLIGDDVESVVQEFRDKVPIIHIKTAGFSGNSYLGYDLFFDAVIDQLLTEVPKEKRVVNILGVVPSQHVTWKGNLQTVKQLLERIGVKANIIFSEHRGLAALKKIPAAELNLVLSPWAGVKTAEKLKERFGTPYEVIPSVPVGPKQSSDFLRLVGEQLSIPKRRIEKVIKEEEWNAYRYTEYMGDLLLVLFPHAFYGVVADTGTAVGLVKFGTNELGWNPEVVIVTDDPPEEYRNTIVSELTEGLESVIKPKVFFETDAHKIRLILQNYSLQMLLASSLERFNDNGEAIHLSISFPVYDRLILDRTYAGYRGGLALMEDLAHKNVGPL